MRFHVGFSFKPQDFLKVLGIVGGLLAGLVASGVINL